MPSTKFSEFSFLTLSVSFGGLISPWKDVGCNLAQISHFFLCLHFHETCPYYRQAKQSLFSLTNCFLSARFIALNFIQASSSWIPGHRLHLTFLTGMPLVYPSSMVANVFWGCLHLFSCGLFFITPTCSNLRDWSDVTEFVAILAGLLGYELHKGFKGGKFSLILPMLIHNACPFCNGPLW